MSWQWQIFDVEPYVLYFFQELARWVSHNAVTIAVLTNVLTTIKIWAIRNNRIKDDKIITWILNFLTFGWMTRIREKKPVIDEPKPGTATPDPTNKQGG